MIVKKPFRKLTRPTTTEASFYVDAYAAVDNIKIEEIQDDYVRPPDKLPSTKELDRQLSRKENRAFAANESRIERNAMDLYKNFGASQGAMASRGVRLMDQLKKIDAEEKARIAQEKQMAKEGRGLKFANKQEEKAFKETWKMVRYEKQAAAYGAYAKSADVLDDRQSTRKAVEKRESLLLKADAIKRQLSINRMTDGPEKEKMQKTYDRHKWYDRLKSIFRGERHLSHEGVQFARGDTRFTNVGRAFYGGTKPMYKFQTRENEIHLYKEAVNCIGMDKPQGALVTEAASKIQQMVCGDAHVPAFAVRSAEGQVMGSMQKMMERDPKGIDLFSVQDDPKKLADTLNNNPNLGRELIREHALDWMLCNFDTKGENFIPLKNPTASGNTLVSIDKEASFNFLKDEGAQHMSYTYKPHANDTFYNVMFKGYAEGRVNLDMSYMDEMVNKIQSIPKEEYMDCFKDMLDNKYAKAPEKRAEAYNAILARKDNIGAEYGQFRKTLNMEREMNMAKVNGLDQKEHKLSQNELTLKKPEKAPEKAVPTASVKQKSKQSAAPVRSK